MRFETHQRRIRAALKRLNDTLGVAASEGVFVSCDVQTTDNSDSTILGIEIRSWDVEEPDETEGEDAEDTKGGQDRS